MVKRFSLGANSESVWERHPKCVKTGDRVKKGNETQSIYATGEIWIAIGIPLVLKNKTHQYTFWLLLFNHPVMSNSVTPWAAACQSSCPSLSPRVCSNSCPLNWWCHPTITSSITLLCSCPQSIPALGSFPMSWFFKLDGQSIGASASASIFPMNIQHWFL